MNILDKYEKVLREVISDLTDSIPDFFKSRNEVKKAEANKAIVEYLALEDNIVQNDIIRSRVVFGTYLNTIIAYITALYPARYENVDRSIVLFEIIGVLMVWRTGIYAVDRKLDSLKNENLVFTPTSRELERNYPE